MPVARAVEMPNQEFASEKPMPMTDRREKLFLKLWTCPKSSKVRRLEKKIETGPIMITY
jgi:hypothetical protein